MTDEPEAYDKQYWRDGNGRRHKRFVVRSMGRHRDGHHMGYGVIGTSTGTVVHYEPNTSAWHPGLTRDEARQWLRETMI